MEAILQAHEQLERKGNLSKAVEDVQKLIDLLQHTRDVVAANPPSAALQMAKLKSPVKQAFETIEDDLKDVNKGLNQYQKALKDKFKNASLPTATNDALSSQPDLINRAIAMHLLREGKFAVASMFVNEVNTKLEASPEPTGSAYTSPDGWSQDFIHPVALMKGSEGRGHLQNQFSEMYNILDCLRTKHELGPAIAWAREHSRELENKGSNLEFELSRLKFVELFTADDVMSDGSSEGLVRAMEYARETFPAFGPRYMQEISSLAASLFFYSNLGDSPYKSLFYNQGVWEEVSTSFTREFCGLLGLSEKSPLYTAVTAGGIALPVLEKVERVMAQTRGQWTSVNELPVETPLPPSFLFHSIFVCPVSKEQATDENPPMMLPCGHVIAKESLEAHSKGKSRMKCPYCPNESHPREAKRVYI
nr:lish domain-containing protein c29a3.03c [Quercus suber]